MVNREIDEDKAFEAALKGKMGWKCPCSLDIMDNKTTLVEKTCKKCGKRFKTNKDKDYCMDCS
ncbi:hypothetical protein LJC03_05075 [Methanobrevibacter sp. OttesenSCG-928-I08]|nr:hypothetical protein [Methanobrevibacter sp. OttesenSCG-928-I08]